MKVYIQSKSGNFNAIYDAQGIGTLTGVLRSLRECGSYASEHRDDEVRVPFEEIEYIRAAKSGD